ncbi:MAG: hypothetical protein CM15mP51_10580 [Porticoccaceae bacterium]|nr:MAG: hypothetical protein CM15mP51_10580 [Porticoccaceae bacterium]
MTFGFLKTPGWLAPEGMDLLDADAIHLHRSTRGVLGAKGGSRTGEKKGHVSLGSLGCVKII